jgi:uncharacterized membrane protein YkvA (DUF1232 family)
MPWYAWLLAVLLLFALLLAATYLAVRANQRGRRFLALPMRAKLRFGRLLLADTDVPRTAKLVLLVLVGYLVLPFDLIPDFLPVIGQLDDLLAIVAVVALLLLIVPHDSFESALRGAEAGDSTTPTSS